MVSRCLRWLVIEQVRTLLDFFNSIPGSQDVQMKTLTDNISWAKNEKRIFLKHSLETRLVGLCAIPFLLCFGLKADVLILFPRQLESQQHTKALSLIDNLLTELKRLDDKMILTEVHLLESRVYREIGNLPKAKVRSPSLKLAVASVIPFCTLGRAYIFKDSCKFYLLSTSTASIAWSSIRHSSCWRQGLHNRIFLLFWGIREFKRPGRRKCARSLKVHAPVQSYVEPGIMTPIHWFSLSHRFIYLFSSPKMSTLFWLSNSHSNMLTYEM